MRLYVVIFFSFFFLVRTEFITAQVFCNYSLGVIYPTNTWQYFTHNDLGYYSFAAVANCNYKFTYCNTTAPNAQFNGDPYLTISTNPTSGGIVVNNDFCSYGSEIQWNAPATGTYYLNVGNCCQSNCTSISSRTFGVYSNCLSTPPTPTFVNASAVTVCSPGQSITLSVGGVVGNAQWFTTCGGISIGTGSSIVVNPTVTTTYFVRNVLSSVASNCISITIVVSTQQTAPVISGPSTVSCNGSASLTSSTGSNTVWYDAPVGGNIIGTGSMLNLNGLINTKTVYAATAPFISQQLLGFSFSNSQQTWTVPNGVNEINITAKGAEGGGASFYLGGKGAMVQANIKVTPNEVLNIFIGGMGGSSTSNALGGFNGGGNGTAAQFTATGGGGGGATDIRRGGNSLANRILVASGGGGAGKSYVSSSGGNGGSGGGELGNPGFFSSTYDVTTCGAGGSMVGGVGGCNSGFGSLGLGQSGRSGGGGGYYGGGAGFNGCGNGTIAGGAGGGSCYADSTCRGIVFSEDFNYGHGTLSMSYVEIQGCLSQLTSHTIYVQGQNGPQISPISPISCNSQIILSSSTGQNTLWFSSLTGQPIHSGAQYTLSVLSNDTTIYAASTNSNNFSQTFNYFSGLHQTWKVPSGVYEINVDLFGAQGASIQTSLGGAGGRIQGKIPVSEGTFLYFMVGGMGSSKQAGFNGGGAAPVVSTSGPITLGGFGGGASDIRIGGIDLMHRKIVAGGGGGFGSSNTVISAGGVGGGLIGGNGSGTYLGSGGSQISGGQSGGSNSSGSLGIGGGLYNWNSGASGGGGGYYGGGGGGGTGSNYSGGGGGSSYSATGVNNIVHTPGYRIGNGEIKINYTQTGCLAFSSYSIQLGSSASLVDSSCSSYTINGSTYNNSGTYTQLLTSTNGCDSVLTLHLTIIDTNAIELSQTACDSIEINGTNYMASGIFNQVLTNSNGCDSTLLLNLTISPSYLLSQQVNACESYTWINGETFYQDTVGVSAYMVSSAGCDSTVTLSLNVSFPSIDTLVINASSIGGYYIGDTLIGSSGSYLIHLLDQFGCDSLVQLNLIVEESSIILIEGSASLIYPNPSSDGMFNVSNIPCQNQIGVYDLTGRAVPFKNEDGILVLSDSEPGEYFLAVFVKDYPTRIFKIFKL